MNLNPWLEPLLTNQGLAHLLEGGNASSKLTQAIRDLSDGLTGERKLVGHDYLGDADMRAAYAAFWWPATYAHAYTVLNHAAGIGKNGAKRVLDMGAGTGACTAALLDLAMLHEADVHITAVDHSTAALEHLSRLVKSVHPNAKLQTDAEDVESWDSSGPFDIIVLGHVLNELFTADHDRDRHLQTFIENLLASLSPQGRLVIIEPALKSTSQDLLRLRDHFINSAEPNNLRIVAPCTRHDSCPALATDDWCHTSFTWKEPIFVRRLSEQTGLDRHRLKMSYLVFERDPLPTPKSTGRISRVVSEPLHTKGRLRYYVCDESGRYPVVAPESRLNDQTADFARLPPGTLVTFGSTIPKGDGLDVSKGFVRIVGRQEDPL